MGPYDSATPEKFHPNLNALMNVIHFKDGSSGLHSPSLNFYIKADLDSPNFSFAEIDKY